VPFFGKEQPLWDSLTTSEKTVNMYFCKLLKEIIALSKARVRQVVSVISTEIYY